MAQHKILVLTEGQLSDIGQYVSGQFDTSIVSSLADVPPALSQGEYKVIVYDALSVPKLDLPRVKQLLEADGVKGRPVVALGFAESIQVKLDALEIGCDDFVDSSVVKDEVCARITKSIYHQVAAEQLSSRLELANQTAHTAMIDNSDLGANIQFLLAVHDCDNLDQLGQLFFATIQRYGLKCSLQMREEHEIKNMEAHGMEKALESQLLDQLKDGGRYIDFGPRTIINYDRVSLLIKNMPVDDIDKYGAIKDNTFSLVQGVNARVLALEDRLRLVDEREVLKKLSSDVFTVMQTIQQSYQRVMRDIADEVDTASECISMRIPSLALTEADELFIEGTMDSCVLNTTKIFNDGLKVDEMIQRLEGVVERSLQAVVIHEEKLGEDIHKSGTSEAPVELF